MNRNISVKPMDRRRDRRRPFDLSAEIEGQAVSLVDLSVVSFGAAIDPTLPTPLSLPVGHRTKLDIWLDDGRQLRLDAEIEREVAEDGVFGGRFIELSDEQYRLVEALLTGRAHRL
ncbi:hypothetical protein [Pelagibius sp.]|uniref:hypothetical protein n=1 Tax=Pelagibius sp. TaxID=1931238 RepID=UPI00260CC1AE|nr:hypothetical protein [Pelagibius sp.]